jgi:lipopolysaccharide/colanic/teichoic acid biosynthesis glycosyltransferase
MSSQDTVTDALSSSTPIALRDIARRSRDVAGSVVLLILSLPMLMVVACLIKLDSPGPLLYRQERVGLNGRIFTLYKLRSMRIDAESDGPRWAAKGDKRVTRVGLFIRAFRIDEVPQLLNILRGDMSLVGPRPERPCFVEQLSQIIPHYGDRATILPGITGWAQINYPYGASVEDARVKLTYDLHYVRNQTLLLDMYILMMTVRVVLFRIGAR